MDNNSDYLSFYKALDLEQQATLRDLKIAFRRQAKLWHPDLARNKQDGEERQRRIREVNISYDRLSRYYKEHRALPLFVDDPSKAAPPERKRNRLRDAFPDKTGNKIRSIIASPLAIPTLLVSLLISIAALVLMMLPTDSPRRNGTLAIPTTDPMPIDQSRYFTFGSTATQVIRIHGEPEEIDGNIWRYGDSIIVIDSGKVIAWETGIEHKLRADPAFPQSFGLPRTDIVADQPDDTQGAEN